MNSMNNCASFVHMDAESRAYRLRLYPIQSAQALGREPQETLDSALSRLALNRQESSGSGIDDPVAPRNSESSDGIRVDRRSRSRGHSSVIGRQDTAASGIAVDSIRSNYSPSEWGELMQSPRDTDPVRVHDVRVHAEAMRISRSLHRI